MKQNDQIQSLVQWADVHVSPEVDEQVFCRICSMAGVTESNQEFYQRSLWRNLMHNRIVQATTAVVVGLVIAAVMMVPWSSESTLSAAEILKKAVEKTPAKITTARIEGRVRSDPANNFSGLSLDVDFCPTTVLWKQDEQGTKWRIDKGTKSRGRAISSNCKKTLAYLWPAEGEGMAMQFHAIPRIGPFDTGWYAPFVEPKKLLEGERDNVVKDKPGEFAALDNEAELEGKKVFVVKVDHKAGVSEKDYIRNHFISETDHTNIYFFDAETNDLLKIQIVAHAEGKDVVIFETTLISYNQPIDDSEFEIKIPETVEVKNREDLMPKALPNNTKYEAMSPKEAATAFFTALHDKNWKEAEVFFPGGALSSRLKEGCGGLEIIEIGEPFQSEMDVKLKIDRWFVPYCIRFPGGHERKHNLALRKHPQAKRYIFDGGL